jgi:hypothetical protein
MEDLLPAKQSLNAPIKPFYEKEIHELCARPPTNWCDQPTGRWLEPDGEQRPFSPPITDREMVKLAPRSEYRRPDGSRIPSRFPLPFRAKSV